MQDMEVEQMDIEGLDSGVDQERRRRAAQKLNQQAGPAENVAPNVPSMSVAQARDIMKNLGDLYLGNRITVDNAFDLRGIDALKTLVFNRDAGMGVRNAEGHFQVAGASLDISMRIYGKRVDAVYNMAYKSLGSDPKSKDEGDTEGKEDPESGANQAEDGADGDGGAAGRRRRKAQGTASVESTLCEDKDLKQRVKELTFDTDPFFVRTSRLIDENSPQGLLLHNLPVLDGANIVFDATVRPEELLNGKPNDTALIVDIPMDLSGLPGAKELLAGGLSLSPDVEELYALLQDQPELPGLKVAAQVDPHALLRGALAENNRVRAEAHINAEVRNVVQHVEDVMDVDMAYGVAAAHGDGDYHDGHMQDDDFDNGAQPGVDRDEGEGAGFGAAFAGSPREDADDAGYGSPGGYDAGGGSDAEEHSYGSGGGGARPAGSNRGGAAGGGAVSEDDAPRDAGPHHAVDRPPSDDESTMLSLLVGPASSGPSTSAALQRTWWKSRSKKAPAAAAGAAKLRARRQKPEEAPVDWRAAEVQPRLEDPVLHTYRKARPDISAKLCPHPELPGRPEDLGCFFSVAPMPLDSSSIFVGGCGALGLHSGGEGGEGGGRFSLHETWRCMLLGDNVQARQEARRLARLAAGQGAADQDGDGGGEAGVEGGGGMRTPGRPRGMNDEDAGGLEQGAGGGTGDRDDHDDGGGGYGDRGFEDGDYDGAGGGAGFDPVSDDEQDGVGGAAFAGPGPSLEALLQPPRRIRRLAVKFDKSAGVADVATLKTNIEKSLWHLVVGTRQQRLSQQQPPDRTPQTEDPDQVILDFQAVLDKVAATAAARGAPTPSRRKSAAAMAAAAADPLAGVSIHLAFICLLHLANEKGLALSNGGDTSTLKITGLGGVA